MYITDISKKWAIAEADSADWQIVTSSRHFDLLSRRLGDSVRGIVTKTVDKTITWRSIG